MFGIISKIVLNCGRKSKNIPKEAIKCPDYLGIVLY